MLRLASWELESTNSLRAVALTKQEDHLTKLTSTKQTKVRLAVSHWYTGSSRARLQVSRDGMDRTRIADHYVNY